MDTLVTAKPVKERTSDVARRRRDRLLAWLLGRPDFWLVIALAAFLRLWHLEVAQFLDDQTYLMQLARGAFLHGAIPVTGIPSSIGTLNPPLSVYLLMPFTLFTANPLPIAIFIALWNAAGVALCYIFTERYFGRWAAAAAALLFATCGAAVNYSRFIWQQNYLPPILALWAWTLYMGCVRGQRRWFVAHVVLLVVAAQLHPTTLLLAPLTVVGLLLAPPSARPSRREYLLAATILVLLFVPTLIWQLVNSGSDLRVLARYVLRGNQTNPDVFRYLFAALGTLSPSDFGPGSPLTSLAPWYPVLSAGTTILFLLGVVVVTVRVFKPAQAAWQANIAAPGAKRVDQLRAGVVGLWRALHADPSWRANLLLWLLIVVPVALMVRHSNALTVHYLMVLYPSAFIVAGIGVQAVVGWARAQRTAADVRKTFARATPVVVAVVLTLVSVIHSVLWMSYPAMLAAGQFDAVLNYGYPLSEVQQADAALASLQREQKAASMAISLPTDARYRAPLDYLLVSEHPGRTDFTNDCLVLPATGSGLSLLVTTQPLGPAGDLAPKLPNARHVADVRVPGGAAWNVYLLSGTTPKLADERAITPIDFVDVAGNGLRLEAISTATTGLIRLRWTVLGSADQPSGTPWYRLQPSALPDSGGQPAPLARTECQPTRWQAGQTVFTWTPLGNLQAPPRSLALLVRGGTIGPRIVPFGPLHLLAARSGGKGLVTLPPSSGEKTTNGALVLPLGVIGLP
ncbi:MAG TPA: glycosyltransferase family 39 protein [Ktedonobacterales bacterium]|nr:glycosyltransferase family 39 protein [Ktedonobacterales bacterium]